MDKRVLAVISMHTLSSMESTPSVHVLPMIAATVRWTTCEGGGVWFGHFNNVSKTYLHQIQ